MKFKPLIAFAFLLSSAAPALAQNPPPTDIYSLKVFAPGAPAALTTSVLVNTDIICNQTPTPAGISTVNPNKVEWDDTGNAGKVCRWTAPTVPGSVLITLPVGSYEGTIVLTTDAGVSPDGNRAPFSRASSPAARTGVRFVR